MFGGFVNLWAVLFVTIISFILGFLWYGPVFGKLWIKLSKMPAAEIAKNKKKGMKGMYKPMILRFVGTFLMVYVFAGLISLLGIISPLQGAILGFWIWLGFFACATLLDAALWDNKSWGLYVLNALYWLINLKVIGFLIVIWS